ncbi:MAG: sigma-70 family RNA polymerase sigma factor [Labilithrix sp.]|nr:sigma-70 family RNA polymerase sigma factor [Labilithrix sp.]
MKNSLTTELDLEASLAESSPDALDLHFRAMTAFRLLTRDDELALARRLERADLSITRALLHREEGREALRNLAAALRDGELRVEDAVRNPAAGSDEDLPTWIDRVLLRARARGRRRSRPRAYGLRLHPRAVRHIARELADRRALEPRNARLRETLADLERYRRDADRATEELVQSNLRIVVTFARRYRGMPLVDLIQEGNLGLLRAIDKFDHRRGLRFSTYAAWWIRHALGRALADQSKMIRLPVHLSGAVQRVRRAQERLHRETGREPSTEELATRTGLMIDQVRRALDVVAQPISLATPVTSAGDREAGEVGDLVPDTTTLAADDVAADGELRTETRDLLSELPEREAEVIRLRFGLGGGVERTLEEIGARLSLSRERARQLERDALRKLRVVSERRRLRAHLSR